MNSKTKALKAYVEYEGKKYVRGQGLMEYKGENKKRADLFYKIKNGKKSN